MRRIGIGKGFARSSGGRGRGLPAGPSGLLALLAAFAAPVAALPAVQISVDHVTGRFDLVQESRTLYTLHLEDLTACSDRLYPPNPCAGSELAQLDLDVRIDVDPFISFSIDVVDGGAPSTFGFVFGSPVAPVAAPGGVTNTITVTLPDGNNSGVSITPKPPGAGVPVDGDALDEIAVFTLSQGLPALLNAGVDVGTGPGTSSDGPKTGPAASGQYDWMQLNVTFGLSGGGDKATLVGTATLGPAGSVPEPATLALLGLGLAGLGVRRRRKVS